MKDDMPPEARRGELMVLACLAGLPVGLFGLVAFIHWVWEILT